MGANTMGCWCSFANWAFCMSSNEQRIQQQKSFREQKYVIFFSNFWLFQLCFCVFVVSYVTINVRFSVACATPPSCHLNFALTSTYNRTNHMSTSRHNCNQREHRDWIWQMIKSLNGYGLHFNAMSAKISMCLTPNYRCHTTTKFRTKSNTTEEYNELVIYLFFQYDIQVSKILLKMYIQDYNHHQ